jgi:Pentatricopeptide repeat domain/PPR repeat
MALNLSRRYPLQLARRLRSDSSVTTTAALSSQSPNLVRSSPLGSSGQSWRIRSGRIRPRTFECHRYFSSPTSNSFWRDLNLAVGAGDGEGAEDIVMGLLKNFPGDSTQKSLDTRIFSLVLQAWKNSEAELAAERAQQLLDQMIALYEEGVLRDPPSLDDHTAVLECWLASGDSSLHAAESSLRITGRLTQHHVLDTHTYELVLQILARGGHSSKAIQFVKASVPKPHSTVVYNWILQAYLNSNLTDATQKAHGLLEHMENGDYDYPEPNGASYDSVLQCWARIPDDPQALENAPMLLTRMKKKQLQTTLLSYQSVISILAAHGEASLADRLLTNLVQDYGAQFDAQLKPTLAPFETVLLAYTKWCHADAAPQAASLLNQMSELYESGILERPPDVWSYNFVLKCWMHSTHSNAADQAFMVLEKMQADGVSPDIATLNTILNIVANTAGPTQAETYLNQIYQAYLEDPIRNPAPDVISFGTVLKAWASKKAPESAERAQALLLRLQNLHESGWSNCQPDHSIFSSVMKCYSYSKNRDAPYMAEAVLRSMQEAGQTNADMKPDTVCWNIAIQGWAQAGDGPRAEALLNEMLQGYLADRENAAAPNVITFSAVLSAWAKTQKNHQASARAETILQQMKQLSKSGSLPNVKPNVISYSIVLDCLAYARSTSAALRAEDILREMKASDDPNVQPNVVSYNSVIKAWSLSRDPNALFKVTALVKEMITLLETLGNKKYTPNANTFGSVLKVLADSDVPDKEERAQVVLSLMEKFGVVMNDWSRNQLRRCSSAYERKGDGRTRGQLRRNRNAKGTDKVPDVSDLTYF